MSLRPARTRTRLEPLLQRSDAALFLLSDRRKLLFFNHGCEALTGWKADDVLGAVCDYATEPDPLNVESLACTLCPPPAVFEGNEASVTAHVLHRDGRPTECVIRFVPLKDEGRLTHVLGIITPKNAIVPRPAPRELDGSLHAELAALRQKLRSRYGVNSLVCTSEPMRRVLEQIHLARASRASVFLTGEPGSGKEHVARVIHGESEERAGAFVPLDCAALRAGDLRRTLLRLLKMDPGDDYENPVVGPQFAARTLYLARVELLPRDSQELLVKALCSDGRRPASDLRLISSSPADLRSALRQDSIRSDFYFLATTITIELPPLRRRAADLEVLAQSLLEEMNRIAEKQVAGFADDVWEAFRQYNWPGNVDELAAVIKEARAACSGGMIRSSHLPFRFRAGMDAQTVGPPRTPPAAPLAEFLRRAEIEHIERALQQSRHNKAKAARLLGMPRAKLYRRMKTLGIADLETP